jgi:hypothetical protein
VTVRVVPLARPVITQLAAPVVVWPADRAAGVLPGPPGATPLWGCPAGPDKTSQLVRLTKVVLWLLALPALT